jgi:hypothetical protein
MKAATARLPRSGGLAVALPAHRLFGALGYADLGAIPNWIRPVVPGRVLKRLDLAALGIQGVPSWARATLRLAQVAGIAALVGWIGGVVLRGLAAALRLPAVGFQSAWRDRAPAAQELDVLWSEARGAFPTAVVRDARYLLDRYGPDSGSTYAWVTTRYGGKLAGIAILRGPRPEGDPRLHGIRVATLVDVLYPAGAPAAGLALLGTIERAARELNADAILATGSAPALHRVLRRQGYLQIGGNVHLLFRDASGETAAYGSTMTEWWLTRGDGNADEAF